MNAEDLSRRPDRQPRPNRDFYLAAPRSAELREVNLEIIRCLLALLHDPEVVASMGGETAVYAKLEVLNGKLIELGIEPDTQVDLDPEIYGRDPVISAEWVAGQLIQFTGERVFSVAETRPILGEFSEFQSDGMHVLDPKSILNRLTRPYDISMIVNGMCQQLGVIDREELSEFSWVNRAA